MSELESEPKRSYRSLFNRTYLKYLGFIVAIAIIFLSEKPIKPLDQPNPFKNSAVNLKVLQVSSLDQSRLFLSFVSFPALSTTAKIDRELYYQSLREAAASMAEIHSVLWTQDRLEVEFRTAASQPLDIQRSLAALVSLSRQLNSATSRKLIAAKQYLQNQALDNAALQILSETLSRTYPRSVDLSSTLKSNPSALLITSLTPTAAVIIDINQQLSAIWGRAVNNFEARVNWPNINSEAPHRGSQHLVLIATELAELSNSTNTLELVGAFVLGELLNKITADEDLSYRLVRQAIFQRGFQAVLLTGKQRLSNRQLASLREELLSMPVEDELLVVKKQLLEGYRQLIDKPSRLYKLYSKKKFYGLITLSPSEYAAQLDTITADQIRQHIRQLLGDNAILIRLQPS